MGQEWSDVLSAIMREDDIRVAHVQFCKRAKPATEACMSQFGYRTFGSCHAGVLVSPRKWIETSNTAENVALAKL